jgi:hypothetical protein
MITKTAAAQAMEQRMKVLMALPPLLLTLRGRQICCG